MTSSLMELPSTVRIFVPQHCFSISSHTLPPVFLLFARTHICPTSLNAPSSAAQLHPLLVVCVPVSNVHGILVLTGTWSHGPFPCAPAITSPPLSPSSPMILDVNSCAAIGSVRGTQFVDRVRGVSCSSASPASPPFSCIFLWWALPVQPSSAPTCAVLRPA